MLIEQTDSIANNNTLQTSGQVGSRPSINQFHLLRTEIEGGYQMTVTPQAESHAEPAFGVHIREAARGLRRLFNES